MITEETAQRRGIAQPALVATGVAPQLAGGPNLEGLYTVAKRCLWETWTWNLKRQIHVSDAYRIAVSSTEVVLCQYISCESQ